MNEQQKSILGLGRALREQGYHFVVPTPLTCQRLLARPLSSGNLFVDVFGWNRPFDMALLPLSYVSLLMGGEIGVQEPDGLYRSRVRFSSLGGMLFAHSGFPTTESDAVFFGPDTYRFARAIRWLGDSQPSFSPRTIIDIGAGSGAGGLFSSELFPNARRIILSDINRRALEFSAVNAALNNVDAAEARHSDILEDIDIDADLIISNPPYLVDAGQRAYRHGGGTWGIDLAVRIATQALDRLTDEGCLMLYTGTPVVTGRDKFLDAIRPVLEKRTRRYRYDEIDPDVFSEELQNPPYDEADRIATVMLFVTAGDLNR
jgi:methylase of polypeptide subunit release factors